MPLSKADLIKEMFFDAKKKLRRIQAGMRIVVSIGSLVILVLVAAMYMKFKKALFVLLIPTAVTALTVFAIIARRHHLVWPLIATSVSSAAASLFPQTVYRVIWPLRHFSSISLERSVSLLNLVDFGLALT